MTSDIKPDDQLQPEGPAAEQTIATAGDEPILPDEVKSPARGKGRKAFMRQGFYFVMGILFNILALRLFFVDNQIAAGGFSGIATVLSSIVPVSVGNLIFMMNCPLIALSAKFMGWKYAVKTMAAMTCYSMGLNLLEIIPVVTTDRFAASVFGGLFYGLGAASLLFAKASVGGTDLVCRLLLRRFRHLSLGTMFLLIDGFCVILAVIIYGNMESGVYALTAIAVFSYATDRIISGFNVARICYVVTNQDPEEVSQEIMKALHVGVTRLDGLGMYEKSRRYLLMVVVRPREIQRLKNIVQTRDPKAFLVVASASEVLGGGFKYVSDQS